MITLNELNLNKLKILALETEIQFGNAKPIIEFSADEVISYLQTVENDKFLRVSFKGELDGMKNELRHINFPKASFGDIVIIKGNEETGLCDIMTIQEGFDGWCNRNEWNPIMAFAIDENCSDTMVDYITRLERKC